MWDAISFKFSPASLLLASAGHLNRDIPRAHAARSMTHIAAGSEIYRGVADALIVASHAMRPVDMFVLAWACGLRLCPCSGLGSRLSGDVLMYDATTTVALQQQSLATRVAEWALCWWQMEPSRSAIDKTAAALLYPARLSAGAYGGELIEAPAAFAAAVNATAAADARALGMRRVGSSSTSLRAASA